MLEAKRVGTPETVEYWFLDDLVKGSRSLIRLGPGCKGMDGNHREDYDWEVTVKWQYGLSTTVPLPMDKSDGRAYPCGCAL